MPGQNVDDDRSRGGTFVQRFGTGSIHGIQPIGWDHAQDLDHLAVAIRHLAKLALHAPDRRRQLPVFEGCPVPECPGLAGKNRNVVQGIVYGLVAAKGACVLPTILPSCQNSTRLA